MVELLKVFRLVAQHTSFTRAAELAELTRPAVSQQIKQLEQHFGVELFTRSTRHVALTPAGRRLLAHAEEILKAAEVMEADMASLRSGQRALLTVAASTLPGESLLPRALTAFREAQPGTELSIRVANTETVLQWVKDGQADLGLIGQRVEDPWLSCEPVGEDEIILALPPGMRLPDPLPLATLREVPLVLREHGSATRATIWGALERGGFDPATLNVVAEVGSPESVKAAVRAGVGAGFVSACSLLPGELQVVRIAEMRLTRPICACWPRHKPLTTAQRALLEQLATACTPG